MTLSLPLVLGVVAVLLLLTGLIEPLAGKLRLPSTVILAIVGIVIGAGASFLLYTPLTDRFNDIARGFVDLPLDSTIFIYLFLPALLFEAALALDVRRLIEDAAPVFLLAVVAVCLSTFTIGFALAPISGEPLVVCLLLGAIVATTDPVAVLAIFRDIGVPARLIRLVEGESLFNDAAAIALFVILLGALTSAEEITILRGLQVFVFTGLGGALVGWICGVAALSLFSLTRGFPPALTTVSVAVPYLVYLLVEDVLGLSGVMAVVAAGITVASGGLIRSSPRGWRHLRRIWEQIAFWASSLIFILTSLLVPKLLVGVNSRDMMALAVLIVAALVARALVLFALMPVLSAVGLSQQVGAREKTIVLWGGLRGALTLALALSITEHSSVSGEAKQFIAVLATGFTLFTLLVNGTTLRPLARLLRLHQLSPFDAGLRDGVLALALGSVRDKVLSAAEQYDIAPSIARDAVKPYEQRIAAATDGAVAVEQLSDRDRLTFGLVALADRERTLLLEHYSDRSVSTRIIERLLADSQSMREAARADGRFGYRRASRRVIDYPMRFRVALWLHRRLGMHEALSRSLADRFEELLVSRIVVQDLAPFIRERVAPVLGPRIAELLVEILTLRREGVLRALDALRLQYPDYANDLERRFLLRIAARREETEYKSLYSEQLIGIELLSDLVAENKKTQARAEEGARLDLGLSTRDLVAQFPLFSSLSEAALDEIARALKPRFAVPGDQLIKKGDRGESVFFISSGAVEVEIGDTQIRLGRGDFAGELAVLYHARRSANVTTIGYCHLLVLDGDAFQRLLTQNPEIADTVTRIGAERAKTVDTPQLPVALGGKARAAARDPAVQGEPAEPAPRLRLTGLSRWRSDRGRDDAPLGAPRRGPSDAMPHRK